MNYKAIGAPLILWVALVAMVHSPRAADASTVRGRLVRQTPQGAVPAISVMVTLASPNNSRRSQPSYSGVDGMYYLYNIPHGTWNLEIWIYGPRGRPLVYTVNVQTEPFSDIAPLVIPY